MRINDERVAAATGRRAKRSTGTASNFPCGTGPTLRDCDQRLAPKRVVSWAWRRPRTPLPALAPTRLRAGQADPGGVTLTSRAGHPCQK